ncbi:hypothetical protein ASG99_12345 [Bacillus sp. Soil768D1]|nr:hypothetical protein ASG99_12345 [Bacillus sp. Soil768D1]
MVLEKKSTVETTVIFSDDKVHRFLLQRKWDNGNKRKATIIMLNPSFADQIKIDLTVMKVGNYLADHEYDSLDIVNLFSYISTDPENLVRNRDLIRGETDSYIMEAIKKSDLVIIAWGSDQKKYVTRKREVTRIIQKYAGNVKCIKDSQGRKGRHPSRLGNDLALVDFFN